MRGHLNRRHWIALAIVGAIGVVGALAWLWVDNMRLRAQATAGPANSADPTKPNAQDTAPDANPAVQQGVRKCRTRGGVEYTTGPCPAGSTEQPIARGSVTVVDLPRPSVADSVSQALTPSGKPLPNARDVLAPAEPGPSLREKQIDAVVNQTRAP